MHIEDPDNFKMATVVSKNSRTGISSNKRLLVIKKSHLYYYSNIPKKFDGDLSSLDNYHELPKCSIQISNIKKINGYENSSGYFSLEFQAKHMMEREDIRKTITLEQFNFAPKNTKEIITWQFTCDNQFIKQRWVAALQTLNAYYSRQKVKIQKFFNNINKKEDDMSGSALRSSTRVPWRDQAIKKSNSNENLRKSYLSNIRKSAIPSNSSQTGSQEANKNRQSPVKNPSQNTSEDIVQNFMKLEKNTQRKISEGGQSPNKNNTYPSPQLSKAQSSSPEKTPSPIKLPSQFSPNTKPQLNQQKQAEKHSSPTKSPQKNEIVMKFEQYNIKIPKQENKIPQKQPQIAQKPAKATIQQQPKPKNNQSQLKSPPNMNNQINLDLNLQEMHFKKTKSQIHIESDQNQDQFMLDDNSRENINLNKTVGEQNFQKIASQYSIELPKTERVSGSKYPSLMKSLKSIKTQSISTIQYDLSSPICIHDLIYFSCCRDYPFNKRIQAQKKLNSVIGLFLDKAYKNFAQFITSKGQGQNTRFQETKISEGVTMLDIGYITYKIGYVSTQALTINGKQKIYYNEESVKQLKRQMKIYDDIFNCIVESLKILTNSKQKSQYSGERYEKLKKLRVPQCTFIQYKGVSALAMEDLSGDIDQTRINDKEQLIKWKEVFTFLGLNSLNFTLKKINSYKVGECVILYINNLNNIFLTTNEVSKNSYKSSSDLSDLKRSRVSEMSAKKYETTEMDHEKDSIFRSFFQKTEKNHNLTFQTPLNVSFIKKAKEQNASVSTASLLRYIKGVNSISDPKIFTCPKAQILTVLEYAYLCKFLRKFYRAAQGEIDELHLINLLLKGDANILQLFESAGFESFERKPLQIRVLGIFFQFLNYYLGIYCEVDTQKFHKYAKLTPLGIEALQDSKKNVVKSVKLQPRIKGFSLNNLELYESFIKFDQYLQNKDLQLAKKALQYKQFVYFDNPFQQKTYPYQSSVEIISNNAQLNFHENDFITTINKGKQFLALCSGQTEEDEEQQDFRWKCPSTPNTIPIYLLMMKCFSKFSQQKFNQMLKQASETAIYNYGEQSSIITTIFSFAGISFSNGNSFEKGFSFLIAALKNGEKVFQNCNKIKLSELCLDIGRLLSNEGKDFQAQKYLKKAAQYIFITESQNSPSLYSLQFIQHKLNFLMHQLQLSMRSNKGFQQTLKSFTKLQNYLKNFTAHKSSPPSSVNLQLKFNSQILNQSFKDLQQLGFQLGMKFNKKEVYQKCIEELWRMDLFSCKILAVELSYKIIGKFYSSINNQYEKYRTRDFTILEDNCNRNLLEREENMNNFSKERALLVLQEKKDTERGTVDSKQKDILLVDLMNQGFQDEDEDIISAVFRLVSANLVMGYQTFA